MKASLLINKFFLIVWLTGIAGCTSVEKSPLAKNLPGHPRLLLLNGEEAALKQNIASDSIWQRTDMFIIEESDKIIPEQPVERIVTGRRLLSKSREALRRIFYLSYSWRMTSENQYLERAEKELLAISAFTDWNPSHFLDVAEMTMAASIGYDWLYKDLTNDTRKIIKEAIVEKGLKPSLDSVNSGWVKASHNWNQVCNAGMTFGALAVYEDEKELARFIIERAVNSITLPMEDYQPDGAYPEGYGYWGYGTSFNILFLSAMEKVYGKDYGLTINPGFFKTAKYLENMTGPSGNSFNYSDCSAGGGMQPAMFWLASNLKDPSLLWSERFHMMNEKPSNDRILPAAIIWGAGTSINNISPPSENIFVGQGKNPVALMRTSWTDADALFVGFKGGSPSVNHGHMDVGSFVMEANGERWAMDAGMQDYNSLESAGVSLWGLAQNSQRWDVFRYNNLIHNTLTVNNQHQRVEGYASITDYSGQPSMINAVSDISQVYTGQLKKSVRGIAIVDSRYVMVQDELEALSTESVIRWNLLTSASVNITGKNTAELVINGKKLILKVIQPANVTMKTWSTVPTHTYDAQNPGTVMVGFEFNLRANSNIPLKVLLLPEGTVENTEISAMNLSQWPKTTLKY